MKTRSVSKIIFSAVIGLAASFSTGAMAESYSETLVTTTAEGLRTATVSYADLDLSDPNAQDTLEQRISRAARKVCGSTSMRETGSLSQVNANRTCYQNAVANAQPSESAKRRDRYWRARRDWVT